MSHDFGRGGDKRSSYHIDRSYRPPDLYHAAAGNLILADNIHQHGNPLHKKGVLCG